MTQTNFKLFIIDDEQEVRELFRIFLGKLLGKDFSFMFFENGLACIEHLREHTNEDDHILVISDINMPIMDGFTFMKNLAQEFDNAEVALCSAYDTDDYKMKGRELGAVDFIAKPVDFDYVARMIESKAKSAA